MSERRLRVGQRVIVSGEGLLKPTPGKIVLRDDNPDGIGLPVPYTVRLDHERHIDHERGYGTHGDRLWWVGRGKQRIRAARGAQRGPR